MDYKEIHHFMQKIDDKWIEEAACSKARSFQFAGFTATAAIILLCFLISTGVMAACSPTFREWLMKQFGVQEVAIEELHLPEGISYFENGFFVQEMDTQQQKVYRIEEQELVLCEPIHMNSKYTYKDTNYDYSFTYVKSGKDILAWNYQGAITDALGYDDNTAIIWLITDNLWNSYYLDYSTGKLSPVVDPSLYSELLAERYYWTDNDEKTEGFVKLAIDVQVSPNGAFLLYRSNRNCLITNSGEYNIESKGEWFVLNKNTNKETIIPVASSYLHTNEIGFIDDTRIGIIGSAETDYKPIRYDCTLNEWIIIEDCPFDSAGYSLRYEMNEKEEEYQFWDIFQNRVYIIPKEKENHIRTAWMDEHIICLLETNSNLKVYYTKQDLLLDIKQESFHDIDSIDCVHEIDDHQFILIGNIAGKMTGYYINFEKYIN